MLANRTIVGTTCVVALVLGFARGQDQKPESPAPEAPAPVTEPVDQPPVVEVPPVALPPMERKYDKTGGFGGIGMPGGAGGLGGPGYSATWYPSQSVSGQPADFALVRQSLNVGVPVWRNGADAILLSAGVRNSLFSTDAILPDSGRPFPGNLWNVNFGLNYMHKFDNGWSSGVMTGFGSASDQPFHGIREMNVNVAAFLRIPVRNDRDSWLLSIFYSPVGNLNFPVPGVAYAWNPSETLHINIGLPFTLMWRPIEDLTINASYVPLTNINARATYKVFARLNVYGGYEFLNESYFLADRVNTTDRFMGFEQRVISGIRWDIWRNATFDLNAGFAFDRYYGEGKNQGSDLRDRVDIAPGAFLGGRLGVRF